MEKYVGYMFERDIDFGNLSESASVYRTLDELKASPRYVNHSGIVEVEIKLLRVVQHEIPPFAERTDESRRYLDEFEEYLKKLSIP